MILNHATILLNDPYSEKGSTVFEIRQVISVKDVKATQYEIEFVRATVTATEAIFALEDALAYFKSIK